MDSILIRGGRPLAGTVRIGGAKNAALPLMAASLLSDGPLKLTNLPHLADIATMAELLGELGVSVTDGAGPGASPEITLTARDLQALTAPYDVVRRMRASVLVLGPLLARAGEARVSLPGGCAIGTRPVDQHLRALEALGAQISIDGGYVHAHAEGGLDGGEITFPFVSVGATENALMAATLAKGKTTIANAAREPEIADLATCLNAMGARITGAGSDKIEVEGVTALHGAEHAVLPDRIETGTYAIAAAMTGGEVHLAGARPELLASALDLLERAGVRITRQAGGMTVSRANGLLAGVDVMTEPYPGFPTDLQAQVMAMLAIARGAGMVTEAIFENRFMHVPELRRMGADITVHNSSALVRGVRHLSGAPVMATDLRASASLVLAGLVAEGETVVNRVYHLDRGYERFDAKLAELGADIERTSD